MNLKLQLKILLLIISTLVVVLGDKNTSPEKSLQVKSAETQVKGLDHHGQSALTWVMTSVTIGIVKVVFSLMKAFLLKSILSIIYSASSANTSSRREEIPWSRSQQYQFEVLPLKRGLIDSDQCLERIYCDTAKTILKLKSYLYIPTLYRPPKSRPRNYGEKWRDIAVSNCEQYNCDPVAFSIRMFIYIIDWNTILKP